MTQSAEVLTRTTRTTRKLPRTCNCKTLGYSTRRQSPKRHATNKMSLQCPLLCPRRPRSPREKVRAMNQTLRSELYAGERIRVRVIGELTLFYILEPGVHGDRGYAERFDELLV